MAPYFISNCQVSGYELRISLNTKFQITNIKQITKTKNRNSKPVNDLARSYHHPNVLVIEYWELRFIWILVLVIWNFFADYDIFATKDTEGINLFDNSQLMRLPQLLPQCLNYDGHGIFLMLEWAVRFQPTGFYQFVVVGQQTEVIHDKLPQG